MYALKDIFVSGYDDTSDVAKGWIGAVKSFHIDWAGKRNELYYHDISDDLCTSRALRKISMLKDGTLTYISLFSSAGVGCFGFKQAGFKCIATNELVDKRLDVQRYNSKCDFESGYIPGDLTDPRVKSSINQEIERWREQGNDQVDVVIATPPCQGISVINHKKNEKDIDRNSLVVESVALVAQTHPRFFVFENVMAFEKAICRNQDGELLSIGEHIRQELSADYFISSRVLNFMNHGSNSSRTRTLVIGVSKNYRDSIVPYDLFPKYRKERTLREVIGDYEPLEWGEIDANDFYHAFRTYRPEMRSWIHDLKEGESAFDNEDPLKRPHRVVNGEVVENIRKNRDKYTRQLWDRFPQCIHTRNDQLAAQNTIHPEQDRVFSIRELMTLMTVPLDFKWLDHDLCDLNELDDAGKKKLYKENELNIRQCLGEAVPTAIMYEIASNIKARMAQKLPSSAQINRLIEENDLRDTNNLCRFIAEQSDDINLSLVQRIVELCNARREENAAFYTNKFIANEIVDRLPPCKASTLRILEPSVGAGSFVPLLFEKYASVEHVILDLVDIDAESLKLLDLLLKRMGIPENFEVNLICSDFLAYEPAHKYDIAVGNPPFSKLKSKSPEIRACLDANINKKTNNLAEFFLEKCLRVASFVALVLNKTILSSDEFDVTRDLLRTKRICSIVDFGRYGFTGVSIETIALFVAASQKPSTTEVVSIKHNRRLTQQQSYITDASYPYFILYRDETFDNVAAKMEFGIFDVFRDRQITKSNTLNRPGKNRAWVIKAKNLKDDGSGTTHIDGYDAYIDDSVLEGMSTAAYRHDNSVYLTPNMTYNPRVIRNVPGAVTDGSVAVLIPKEGVELSDNQMQYFTSPEYRNFYQIARNLSTQSINVDKTSVFFFGAVK